MGLICHENELKLSLNPVKKYPENFFQSSSTLRRLFEKKMCEIGEIVFGGNYGEP